MKIALVIDSFSKGGAERQVLYLSEELAARGCDVEVIHYYQEEMGYERPVGPRVKFTFLSRAGGPLVLLARMWRHLRGGGFDVVHAFKDQACIYGCLAGILAGVPVVLAGYRCQYQGRGLTRMAHRLLDRCVTAWVVNSGAIVESLVREIGVRRDHCAIIHNGIDAGRFVTARTRPEAKRALGFDVGWPIVTIIGRLRPEKNHALFIEMAARVHGRFPEARFLVVGDGELKPDLEAQAGRLGMTGRVVFLDNRSDIPEILSATDVYVLTSFHEGMPNTVLEAMSAAVPVVCTKYPGVDEVFSSGVEGSVAPNHDPEALSERVCVLLQDESLRMELGRRGRERAESHFSRRALGDRSLALYQRYLREAVARRA